MTDHHNKFTTEMLLKASPEYVADWLRERVEERLPDTYNPYLQWNHVDENRLLERNDPLITLALARWGVDKNVVQKIFLSTPHGSVDKVATLMNSAMKFPYDLIENFWGDKSNTRLHTFLKQATDHEISALMSNQNIATEFAKDWVSNGEQSKPISDEMRCLGVRGLTENPLITDLEVAEKHDFEFSIRSLRSALWNYAKMCPTTPPWAYTLSRLYEAMTNSTDGLFSNNSIDFDDFDAEFLHRWQDENIDEVARDTKCGNLTHKQRIRHFLSVITIKSRKLNRNNALNHDDIAVQLAAARACYLDVEQVEKLVAVAPTLAFPILIENLTMWRKPEARNSLETAETAYRQAFEHWELSRCALRRHAELEAKYESMHPEWFPHDEAWDEDDTEIYQDARTTVFRLGAVEKVIGKMSAKLDYVLWFSLGGFILAVLIYR